MKIRTEYDEELKKIHDQIRKMGAEVETAIDRTITAFEKKDVGIAMKIIRHDDVIDGMEQTIEDECIRIVIKQAPLAADWRLIAAYMRMISDLERIADNCSDIALYIKRISADGEAQVPDAFREIFYVMREMAGNTIESFFTGNMKLADKVITSDDAVDYDFERIRREVIESVRKDPDRAGTYIDYLIIGKYVERMADHCTNIASWVKFIVLGELKMYYTDRYKKAGSNAVFYQ